MRILGVDYGKVRIGLAICDPDEIIASPLDVWATDETDPERFGGLIRAEGVEAIVVGLPVRTDGTEGPEAEAVRRFADELREALGLPVEFFDERFTTQGAQRSMLAADLSRRQRRDRVDKVAAQAILEAYIQRRKRARPDA